MFEYPRIRPPFFIVYLSYSKTMTQRKIKIILFLVVLLFTANFLVWREVFSLGNLDIVFFDIGQGDSIFIESGLGHQVVIDGGPSNMVLEKLTSQMPFWDRSIDLVILTHPDYDHLRGLVDIIERYHVGLVLWTGSRTDSATFEKWNSLLSEQDVLIAQKGQVIKMGDASLDILYPFVSLKGEKGDNDSSIVARLVFGETSFLFTGDITKKVEKDLLESGVSLNSQVLKVAHHGSKSSSSFSFIKEVDPVLAIISCGKENSYGHPHQEVLSLLEEFGILVLRTDKVGDIELTANSSNFLIKQKYIYERN